MNPLRTAVALRLLPALVLGIAVSGCFGYRLTPLDEVEFPTYEPREVLIPAECDSLIHRAATHGMATLDDGEARTVLFCQQQQMIRAQEEEAAARRLEAHASAARFALQLTTVVIGALIVVIGWLI